MGDDDRDPFNFLFGYLVYREIRDGRLDADAVIRSSCLFVLLIGAVIGGGLLLVGLATPRSDSSGYVPYETPVTYATEQPAFIAPATAAPTIRPSPTTPPNPSPTAKPSPRLGIGVRVQTGGGWSITVIKVERWRPSWYRQPGWRLLTAYLKIRMPAVENGCIFPDTFVLEASSRRSYQGTQERELREPQLFDCPDYHRPTTAAGWVTFEVRDADAKGLVLDACLPDRWFCEEPAQIPIT